MLGMIKLRMGRNRQDYEDARRYFDKFLDLSGRSRFWRESFQGYRNIALCEYNLAFQEPEKKKEWLDQAIQDYDYALRCLGCDPEQACQQPRSPDEFIARCNRSSARVELVAQDDMGSVVKELVVLEETAPNWHWRANTRFLLCKAYLRLGLLDEVLLSVERMVKQYENVEDKQIEKQLFGVQNARRNLQFADDCLNQMARVKGTGELHKRVVEQVERVGNLSQYVPPIPLKDWSASVSEIEKKFLRENTQMVYSERKVVT